MNHTLTRTHTHSTSRTCTSPHRAGRTARAGRSGKVFTLLRNEDVRHFKQMLRKADNTWVGEGHTG